MFVGELGWVVGARRLLPKFSGFWGVIPRILLLRLGLTTFLDYALRVSDLCCGFYFVFFGLGFLVSGFCATAGLLGMV